LRVTGAVGSFDEFACAASLKVNEDYLHIKQIRTPTWCCRLMIVQLWGVAGYGVDMRVIGYQFPDANDPAKRCSWHMVEGTASCADGSWSWRYPALTCDESPRLSAWLRDVGDAVASGLSVAGHPVGRMATLRFLEPNLSLTVVGWARKAVVIDIGLDLEFAPPWQPRRAAGNPYRVRCDVDREHLLQAAEDWDAEIAPYPDN
jgi:hypothetical protein